MAASLGAGLDHATQTSLPKLRPHQVNAGQPTGLPITFTASGDCSVASSTVTLLAAGSCTITAHQDGNDTYNAAAPVSQTFAIAKAPTTVTVSAPKTPYNDSVALSASVSPVSLSGQTLTGTVTFAIDGTTVGSASLDATGTATPAPVNVTQAPGDHTVTAAFVSRNANFKDGQASSTLTVTQEDTTVTYGGDTSGDYGDPVTLKALLLEDGDASKPLAGKAVSFTLGTQSCSGTTGGDGVASCTLTPTQVAGTTYTAAANFGGTTTYASSTDAKPFVIKREETTVAYTGPTLIAQGRSATLSGVLKEDGTTPIAGRTLTLSVGSGSGVQSCTTAATDATGGASCTIATITQAYGSDAVSASFAGDASYLPASDTTKHVLIFGYLDAGSFVLGNTTAAAALTSGSTVTWWGAQWAGLNTLTGGAAPDSFKGFASDTSASPPACGGTWTARPGNSGHPPDSVPAYLAVVVSSSISKTGSTISGDIVRVVIVKTDTGYAGNPGHAGTGTVVASLCPTPTAPPARLSAKARRTAHAREQTTRHSGGSSSLGIRRQGAAHAGTTLTRRVARQRAHAASHPQRMSPHSAPRVNNGPAGTCKADQKIEFGPLADKTFGDAPFVVAARSIAVSSSCAGATLTLTPKQAGPNVVGTSQAFQATLLGSGGAPITNASISFAVTGANPTSGTGTTDSSGVASFHYTGNANGTDTVQATLQSATLQSNTATVSWVTPVQPVTTTTVLGQFFSNGCGSFCHSATDTPVFSQSFPTINFNPPGGTVPFAPPSINVNTRPFTDVTTDVGGNYSGSVVAQGNGYQAGVGSLVTFDAAFTANFTVAKAGDVTYNFYSDDGFIFGIQGGATRVSGANANPPPSTPMRGYPIMGAYNGPTAPVANSITVHFPAAGTYPYEVDYSECCGGEIAMTMATTGTGHGVAPAGNLALTPVNVSPQSVGQSVNLTVAAMDASGRPIASLPVTLNVTGANTQQVTGTTDAQGLATLRYVGLAIGVDHAQVGAAVSGMPAVSNLIDVPWILSSGGSTTGPPPPAISNPLPADGSIVTKPVPITASIAPPSGQTITAWKVTYQALDPEPVVTVASGTGTPPDTLATFDPTLLPNDTYAIAISATASGGGTQTVTTTVAVSGNLKLGRYTTSYQDLSVPVNGFQMEVRRTYDSYDKRVGDFGVGWHVAVDNFRTSTNRILGAGGWTQYNSSCAIGLCTTAFRTSTPHFVTVTFPDGHQEMFDFTPTGGTQLFGGGKAAFTARPGTGTTSTLEAQGDTNIGYQYDGNLYGGNGPYDPQRFTLTTHDGRILVLDRSLGLISETDRNGNSLTVDSSGVYASNGQSITYVRDSSGRITDIAGPTRQHLHYGYSDAGNLTDSVDANGNQILYNYDGNHHLLGASGLGGKPFQTLTYDNNGRLTAVTDGDGNTTTVGNNVSGQQQTVTDPNGKLNSVYTYDDLGDLVRQDQVFSGKTLTSTFTYDTAGRPLTKTDPLGNVTTATYDSAGNLVQYTNPQGGTNRLAYDSFGQLTTMTGADGRLIETLTYDNHGNASTLQRADGSTVTYSYNSGGQLTQVSDALGRATNLGYDAMGHLSQVTDPLGHVTHLMSDASGNRTAMTDASGATTTYSYDAGRNLASVTDPNGHTRTFSSDYLGHQLSATDPLGHIATSQYDAGGHLVQSVDRNGKTITYKYDVDGRLASETLPSGEATVFSYDPVGRLIDVHNNTADLKYEFDAASRITSVTTTGTSTSSLPTVTLSYAYDAAGNRTSVTGPTGTTNYAYDVLSRLTGLTDAGGNHFGIRYDSASRPITLTRPNGVSDALAYDSAGQLTGRVATLGSTTLASAGYKYDTNGRRTSVTDLSGTSGYNYDIVGRLISATHPSSPTETYTYDATGNRLSSTTSPSSLSYDAADRLISDASSTYSYDANGNQVTKTDKATGKATSFDWNGYGQLVAIHYPDGKMTSYRYDPFGRRVEVNAGGTTSRYVYDGSNIHLEYDGSNAETASYTDLPAADGVLEMLRGGQRYYYLQDGLGSVTGLTTASGALAASYQYDSFGNRTATTGSVTNPFTYTGREYDAKSGLYYDRARYYDASSGRFTSEDPVASVNPYSYAGGDPVNNVDPSGGLAIEYFALAASQLKFGMAMSSINRCLGQGLLYLSEAMHVAGVPSVRSGEKMASDELVKKAFGHLSDTSVGLKWGIVVGTQQSPLDHGNIYKVIDVGRDVYETSTLAYAALVDTELPSPLNRVDNAYNVVGPVYDMAREFMLDSEAAHGDWQHCGCE